MSNNPYYSHRKEGSDPNPLEKHLRGVAKKAEKMVTFHNSQNWAYLAGIWHDLGKYQQGFQDYLRKATTPEDAHIESENKTGGFLQKCPHSHAGAVHAEAKLKDTEFGTHKAKILGYIIAGHHTGLPDGNGSASSLSARLGSEKAQGEYQNSKKENIPDDILNASRVLDFPQKFKNPLSLSLWIRMLFSCLVDSDFLDTEEFMSPDKTGEREGFATLSEMKQHFDGKIQAIQKTDTDLNKLRTKIYNQCLQGAKLDHKFFSLTVPTGGGKTLSSLGFALEHAIKYNKKRIIYAIPYTSIIEQNAEVFKNFLPENSLIEHHSNLDESHKDDTETSRNRLAAENWDAPLIVTTNVQLFESLFASRTSRCRKLHNLQNSIIILDEAQMLPRDFLTPITETMKVLADEYNVTWVLCTATQPNLKEQKNAFGKLAFHGLDNVHELMQGDIHPEALSNQLKRVDIRFADDVVDYATLADEIIDKATIENKSVLAIVNTRNDCRILYNECKNKSFDKGFDNKNLYHLSALMCAEHRSDVIKKIKADLIKKDTPIIVISTQLVEAGVDLDFPVVYRAMTGLDSIAQAAGRCNREGRLKCDKEQLINGEVVVFDFIDEPVGFLGEVAGIVRRNIDTFKENPLSPCNFQRYFEILYQNTTKDKANGKTKLDKENIINLLKPPVEAPQEWEEADDGDINFRTASYKFKLIQDDVGNVPVVVFYNPKKKKIKDILDNLKFQTSKKSAFRQLQRYTVNLRQHEFDNLIKCIKQEDGVNVFYGEYDEDLGLMRFNDERSSAKNVI